MVGDESRKADASEWSAVHSPVRLRRCGATGGCSCESVEAGFANLDGGCVPKTVGMPVWAHKERPRLQ